MWLVPKLATARGWRAIPLLYGSLSAAMCALWHFWAADRPASLAQGDTSCHSTMTFAVIR